jgi:hypothetical protein
MGFLSLGKNEKQRNYSREDAKTLASWTKESLDTIKREKTDVDSPKTPYHVFRTTHIGKNFIRGDVSMLVDYPDKVLKFAIERTGQNLVFVLRGSGKVVVPLVAAASLMVASCGTTKKKTFSEVDGLRSPSNETSSSLERMLDDEEMYFYLKGIYETGNRFYFPSEPDKETFDVGYAISGAGGVRLPLDGKVLSSGDERGDFVLSFLYKGDIEERLAMCRIMIDETVADADREYAFPYVILSREMRTRTNLERLFEGEGLFAPENYHKLPLSDYTHNGISYPSIYFIRSDEDIEDLEEKRLLERMGDSTARLYFPKQKVIKVPSDDGSMNFFVGKKPDSEYQAS